MLSDFVVPGTRHKRLAKLLLMVARYADMKTFFSDYTVRGYKAILTAAFTEAPVSMKYRVVYELAKRGPASSTTRQNLPKPLSRR